MTMSNIDSKGIFILHSINYNRTALAFVWPCWRHHFYIQQQFEYYYYYYRQTEHRAIVQSSAAL
jgi:hypothetical protein